MENQSVFNALDEAGDDTTQQLQNILAGAASEDSGKSSEASLNDVVIAKAPSKEENKSNATMADTKHVSPLERLKQEKQAGKIQAGMVVSDEDLKKGAESDDKIVGVYNEDRINSWDDYLADMDKTIENRKYVTLVRSPKNKFEYMQMMDEVESIVVNDGVASIKYTDKDGNPVAPRYIRLRKEGEPEFDFSPLKDANSTEKLDPNAPAQSTPDGVVNAGNEASNNTGSNENVNAPNSAPAMSEEKAREVQVIIDKTGLGVDFKFTEEEREKLRTSELIHVKEVHDAELRTIIGKRNTKSFSEFIGAYNSDATATMVPLPASGFRARMRSMSYGEYSDVALSIDTIDFDLYRKRLTVLYNNMIDTTHGAFESFDDFIKNIAYTDVDMALYALFVATQPEEQDIELRCGNNECGQTFNWNFLTRSVLRVDRCPDAMISAMGRLAKAAPAEYDDIYEHAPVRTTKTIELPKSKILAEIGIGSAYHFLYNFVPVLDEDTFIETFGDEASIEVHLANAALLPTLLKVYVPDGDGSYFECETYKDILNAIYILPPGDMKILMAYCAKVRDEYTPVFSLGTVKCPHCNTETTNMDVPIDTLVFRMYQRLINTEISLENIVEV